MNPLVVFIVFACVAAIFLWVLTQFPAMDGTVAKFIRIAVLVVLALMLLNVVLHYAFGTSLRAVLGS